MNRRSLAFALCAFACGQMLAQSVPPLVNYQGQLSDAQGNALPTADYPLTFNIYAAATGGSPVWGPQEFDGRSGPGRGPQVPVVQGWFNVMLGPVDTLGRSLANAFNNPDRWVEITVGNNPPIAPRQRVLSAPFALMAASVSDAAITSAKIADGAIQDRHINVVSRLSASDGEPANVLFVDPQGRVGIGTESPLALLDLAGDAQVQGTVTFSGQGRSMINMAGEWYGIGVQTATIFFRSGHSFAWYRQGTFTNALGDAGEGGVRTMFLDHNGSLVVRGDVTAGGRVFSEGRNLSQFGPPGMIVAFGGPNVPSGWLLCDGRAVSRTGTYEILFSAIGTSWGAGDGSTTFHLPDLRGFFLRGVSGTSTNDPDRNARTNRVATGSKGNSVGSYQDDELKSHTHGVREAIGNINEDGPWMDTMSGRLQYITEGVITPTGGSETRPKNAYVHYIIKY